MAVTAKTYPQFEQHAGSKAVNLTADALKVMLLSAYAFNSAHATIADVLATRSVTDGATTAASTTVTSATAAFTAADVGRFITGGSIPAGATITSVTNGTTVVISAAATATATAVTLNIFSGTEATGTGYTAGGQALTSVAFTTSGAVSTLTAANPSWASSTITAAYAVFYDAAGGTNATDYPICYWDFGGAQSSSAGTFTLTVSGSGLYQVTSS